MEQYYGKEHALPHTHTHNAGTIQIVHHMQNYSKKSTKNELFKLDSKRSVRVCSIASLYTKARNEYKPPRVSSFMSYMLVRRNRE